ncbi:MAG: GGDEF domain-containing protein [Roseburia sp.]|nr:GGDEF domain-containing protein [Roseburia sp.]
MNVPDKISRKTILKALWLLYALISTAIWLPQIDKLFAQDMSLTSRYISLDDSWDITIHGQTYQDVSLSDFTFDVVNKGDEITMQKVLPDTIPLTEGTLRFHIRQSAVRMYLDGEQFYEYGYERMAQNKTVGSGFQFINFPGSYAGKTLTIHLYLSEDAAFSRFDSIRLYEWENAYRILMTENRIPLFTGCFLSIFGLVSIIITIFALAFSIKYIRLFCIALFSMLMGLWTLCYYNVILIFSIPLYSISLLEYLTLYLAPLPLIIYMWEDVKNLEKKLLHIVYWVYFAFHTTATFCMIALHATDTVHCAATLKYMQILIVCGLILFIIIEILNLKSSKTTGRLFLVGMIIIASCIFYDLVIYWNNRYHGKASDSLRGVTSLGIVFFIFILIVSFYINLTQKLMQETERNFLIKSAYTDELTQIHNRRYCMEYMNKIKEAETLDYTVICFDLNNLKITNDTYGHAQGDILIKSAAEVIAETFEANGLVARMGGDEFIAIIETAKRDEISRLLEQFQINLRNKNNEVENLNMSIAFGYASCNSKEYNIEKIYQIADNRMYENKKRMKSLKA